MTPELNLEEVLSNLEKDISLMKSIVEKVSEEEMSLDTSALQELKETLMQLPA